MDWPCFRLAVPALSERRSRGRRRPRCSGPLLLILALLLACAAFPLNAQTGIGGDFSLTDQESRPFALNQLRGRLVLLFFGYTLCPDVCPTELSNLAAVLDALGPEADRVQGLFVSLDPERDTPSVLQDYVSYFGGNLIGLTGSSQAVERVAKQYRVNYQRHERPDGRYTLDHSANLYVIDPRGELSAVVPYGLPPEHLLELVRGMLAEGG